MHDVLSCRFGQAVLAALLLLGLASAPAAALDLFARHRVDAQFATSDGKPMADAEVRVFAPGYSDKPALTGRTDSEGRFEFSANEDGLWSAEAHTGAEIARVTVRVGGATQGDEKLSPAWVIGGLLLLLLAVALGHRILRARLRPPAR